jgi:trans-2-enoyl-CoA reductase
MEKFDRTIYLEGWESAVSSLTKDLSQFSKEYNDSTDFLQSQKHSVNLRSFSNEITDHLRYNSENLRSLGFSFSEEGRLDYDRSVVEGMTHNRINIVIGENMRIFNDLQRHSERALTEPLIEHMNFRGLGYHYNYKLGAMKADGFNLLEVGLLIDEVV